jgi:hypothetical protein
MDASQEFVCRKRGGGYAIVVLFMVFPAMVVFAVLEKVAQIPQGPIPAAVIAGLALVTYFTLGSEHRVVLDDHGIRFSRTTLVLGMRRAEQVFWQVPAAALTSAREVTSRSPSSRGGWNTTVVLHLPEGRKILEVELGMKGVPASPYDALVAALARRLGDRFTTEQVT